MAAQDRSCRTCGALFRPAGNNQYCDDCRAWPACQVRYDHCLHPDCGRLFVVRTTGLYCSPRCKRTAPAGWRNCQHCGDRFAVNGSQKQVRKLSCSPACRAALISEAMTERHAAGLHPKAPPHPRRTVPRPPKPKAVKRTAAPRPVVYHAWRVRPSALDSDKTACGRQVSSVTMSPYRQGAVGVTCRVCLYALNPNAGRQQLRIAAATP